jgi:hypothetical protein
MPTTKMIVTTTPDVVSLLTFSRQTLLPASSFWQITPGAQVALGVIVGVQPIVDPLVTEQTLVVTIFVTEHTRLVVVFPVVSLAAVTDAVVESLVVEDGVEAVVESSVEVEAAAVEAAAVVEASAVEGAVVVSAAAVVLVALVVFSTLSVLVCWSCVAVSPAVVFPPFFAAEVVSVLSCLLLSSP